MKIKPFAPVLLLAILAIFGFMTVNLNASETDTLNLTITIQTLSVVRTSTPTAGIMAVLGGDKVFKDPITYKNAGNGYETFKVKIGADTGGWTLVSTKPGKDEFRLSGIWHHFAQTPATSEFQTDDILTKSDQTSSDKIFFNENETHVTLNNAKTGNTDATIPLEVQRAMNVPAGEERNLFIRIELPSSVTPGVPAGKIQLLLTAIPADI